MIHELSIDEKYNTVHNGDGILVFNVAEPGNPKYTIVQLTEHDGIDMGADGDYVKVDTMSDTFRRNTTLIASEYPLRYRQGTSAASPQALGNLAQLDVAALTSVWPHGNFRGRKTGNGSNSVDEAQAPTNPVKVSQKRRCAR